MNRTIKFRAWNKEEQTMIPADRFIAHSNMFDSLSELIKRKQKHFVLMQYIGLEDKNGKEIYEGDILSSDGEISKYNYIVDKKEFSCGCCGYTFGWSVYENNIIIGNIYENPELIVDK